MRCSGDGNTLRSCLLRIIALCCLGFTLIDSVVPCSGAGNDIGGGSTVCGCICHHCLPQERI